MREKDEPSDADGTKLCPSVAALRRGNKCVNSGECGIVEVEVRVIRWVEEQKWPYTKDGVPFLEKYIKEAIRKERFNR